MTLDPSQFPALELQADDQVLTVKMRAPKHAVPGANLHWEMGELMSQLRGENDYRVVVLTGYEDGTFLEPGPASWYEDPEARARHNDPKRHWRYMTGMTRLHENLTAMEKPIIAKVNGDCIGFGQSIMFGCDLAIAREDAVIYDHHVSNAEGGLGTPYGIVPGDGGAAFVPSHLSPMLAKEYLMLCRRYTGRELADMHVINAAVPAAGLDAAVDDMVARLLAQSAYALAWTKRVVNRTFVSNMLGALDAASAFELVNFYQAERSGWQGETTL